MDFGIPQLRKAKKEKYEFDGVITFEPTGEKKARRMVFNAKAIELLKFSKDEEVVNQIAFSFSGKQVFIANVTGLTNVNEAEVKKNMTVSHKKYYEYIKDLFEKSEGDEVEFFLHETENEFNGVKVYELKLTQPEEKIENVDLDKIPVREYVEDDVQDLSILPGVEEVEETEEVATEESTEEDPLMSFLDEE